jgi:hypothetical protein
MIPEALVIEASVASFRFTPKLAVPLAPLVPMRVIAPLAVVLILPPVREIP